MSTKTLGIIGGMGPQASAGFYNLLIENTIAEKDQDHIDLILLSHASIPDRTTAILNDDSAKIIELLQKDIEKLVTIGADFVVLTCNTSHLFIDQLGENASIPIVSMIDTTVEFLQKNKISKVGLMATDGTVQRKIYTSKLENAGIKVVLPSEEMQQNVMRIIYDQVKKGKSVDEKMFDSIANELKMQCVEAIILGCTELSYYGEIKKLSDLFIDPQKILARKCIELCGGKLTKE